MSIKENLIDFSKQIPKTVQLIAVSKTKPNEDIMEAYHAGHRSFGENKIQDLRKKAEELPKDIRWHYIGHLQTNKIKYIAPFIHMIEAIDSLKLLAAINKEALKNKRTIDVLLQFHIAEEESKFGLDQNEAEQILQDESFQSLKNIRVCGVMGMASYTDDKDQIRSEFAHLRQIFNHLKDNYFQENDAFKEISMGMSNDYQIAIEEGSSMIRIGTAIFGLRSCALPKPDSIEQ